MVAQGGAICLTRYRDLCRSTAVLVHKMLRHAWVVTCATNSQGQNSGGERPGRGRDCGGALSCAKRRMILCVIADSPIGPPGQRPCGAVVLPSEILLVETSPLLIPRGGARCFAVLLISGSGVLTANTFNCVEFAS